MLKAIEFESFLCLFCRLCFDIEDSDITIAALYIPPGNTRYYTEEYFENLYLLLDFFLTRRELYLVGDLNSRLGNQFPQKGYPYMVNSDAIINQSGRKLIHIF